MLRNVLPASIAERLKEREGVIADVFPEVSMLFADIVERRSRRSGMLELAARRRLPDGGPVRLRVGIDSGPVVAGVIETRKFS